MPIPASELAVVIIDWNSPNNPIPPGPSNTARTFTRRIWKTMLMPDANPIIEVARKIC
jgi:hypothetical protein